MKRQIQILFVLGLSALVIGGCGKPEACIQHSETTVNVGDSVKFTSCSSKASVLEWDFGDNTASQQDPEVSHYWESSGTYTITLTAYKNSNQLKKKKKIHSTTTSMIVTDFREDFEGDWIIDPSCDVTLTAPYTVTINKDPDNFDRILIDNLFDQNLNNVRGDVTAEGTALVSNLHRYWDASSNEFSFGGTMSLNAGNTQLTLDLYMEDEASGNNIYDCIETANQ